MKLKYLFIGFFLFATIACSKKDNNDNQPGNNDGDKAQPVSIERVIFTDPGFISQGTGDPAIMNNLAVYLNQATDSSEIYMSIYLFYSQKIINALSDAYNRGVEVHLMIDSGRSTSRENNKNTFPHFRNLLKGSSEMVVVNNDNNSSAINHEKFVLFSELKTSDGGIAKNVVFATSHNFAKSAEKRIQDAVVMTNKELYNVFKYNWQQVAARAKSGMTHFEYEQKDVGDSITACFFPRRENGAWDGEDNIVNILDKLNGDHSKDTIRVFMAFWTRKAIADKLLELQKNKATVEIVTRDNDDVSAAVKGVLQEIENEGGYVKMSGIYDHAKCMLIKGVMDGEQQKWILTGSHNYTQAALKTNNEFMLILKNSKLFPEYWSYFEELQFKLP